MFRKILIVLVAVFLLLGISKLAFAMMCGQGHGSHNHVQVDASTQANYKEAVNVGNKICPVSGEKIDEKTKATYEYEAKIYNFCCAKCVEDFKKDPEKYIKKVDEELKSESEAESDEYMMMPESEMSEGMHGSGHRHHGN